MLVVSFLLLLYGTGATRLLRFRAPTPRGSIPADVIIDAVQALAGPCSDLVASFVERATTRYTAGTYRRVDIAEAPGLVMAVHPKGELVSDSIVDRHAPFCPSGLTYWLRKQAQIGPITLLDVGANIGSCTLLALWLGHSVVAAEPQPENLELLLVSLALSELPDSAKLYLAPYAMGQQDDDSIIITSKGNMGGAMVLSASLSQEAIAQRARTAGLSALHQTPICVRRMDDVLQAVTHASGGSLPPVAAVKVDVQGHEVSALLGMQQVLSTAVSPQLARLEVEVWPAVNREKGDDPQDIFNLLSPRFKVTEFAVSFGAADAGGGAWQRPTAEQLSTAQGWERATAANGLPHGYALDTTWEPR